MSLSRYAMLCLVLVGALSAAPARVAPQAAPQPSVSASATVVYVLRHAERATDDPVDPTLTPEGTRRAHKLDSLLADKGVRFVHSTALKRATLTAEPLAKRMGLAIDEYAPTEQRALADRIRAARGVHVVIGHSNTVPELIRLLGGDPGTPIGENEYDRLYVVTIAPDGRVTTSLQRF
jgi:phosphohistidine phosphatase SixA